MLKRSLFIMSLFCLSACSHIAYYSQAISGQWEIFKRSQPIKSVLANPTTPIPLQQQLAEILKIRAFASQVLHLPDNRSYTYYADLKRPFVVWSVFAVPTFSLEPKQWCFPILGCISYRGYFSEKKAHALAQELRAQGYDVYIAGIAAYSTLGWFADPVLNTMLRWNQYQIAGLIFHELAHQKLYISNDTAFNEAFAMTIEYVGVERWLAQYGTVEKIADYQQSRQRQTEFTHLVLTTRNHLQHVYQQNLPSEEMQMAKTATLDRLRMEYAQLKKSWGGYTGYDNWFAKDLNNAKLLSVVTYQDYVPAFQALLAQQGGNLLAFYNQATQLGELPLEERHAQLRQIGEEIEDRK